MSKTLVSILSALCLLMALNVCSAENISQGVNVIVIDAGHGGPRFPGARYFGVCEKDINLQVALKLGERIERECKGVKVVYTRKREMQFSENLSEDLQARANIANSAGGDLFISIHSNAARNPQTSGVETLIMGESSKETAYNENVLFANNKDEFIDMSDTKTAAIVRAYIQNLQYTYGQYSEMMAHLVQKHYVAIGKKSRGVRPQLLKVLYATDMPSILTEIGFMSNPKELKEITSPEGQDRIVGALLAAVKEYIEFVGKTLSQDPSTLQSQTQSETAAVSEQDSSEESTPAVQPEPVQQPQTPQPEPEVPQLQLPLTYGVQIRASKSSLPVTQALMGKRFKEVREVRGQGAFSYKYVIGNYNTRQAASVALQQIRKDYKDCYIVTLRGDIIAQ